MRWNPHPFQLKAARKIISHKKCMLFIRMGLGKTAISLTAIDWLIKHKRIGAAMIFAPLRVIENSWPDEIEKWNHLKHLRYTILHGKNKDIELKKPYDLYLINYEGIKWFFKEVAKRRPSHLRANLVVFDESRHVKSTDTKRFEMLRWLKQYWDYRIAMTGTPAPNSILDIFGQYFLIDDGRRLGTRYETFKFRYFTQADYDGYKWVPKSKSIPFLANRVKDITFRLTESDHVKIPEIIEHNVEGRLPHKLREQYEELEREFFLRIDEVGIQAFNAAALSNKLRQFIQGGIYYDQENRKLWKKIHEMKVDMIQEIVEDYDFPTIVVIQFRFERELIKERFPHAVTTFKKHTKEQWNDEKIKMLVVHPASMSEGLNLQHGGHTVIWAALPWSSGLYDQMNSRIARQGQKYNVILHHLMFKNTIETRVLAALRLKISNQNKFLMYIRGIE